MSSPYFIERKAVNVSGRLGSLYDVSSDALFDGICVENSENPQFYQHSMCQVFRGSHIKDVIHLLNVIKFDDTLLQSILLNMVKESGISSLIHYNQPINENTCFLYYSYTCRREKLSVTDVKANKIISISPNLNNATHMITEIISGFEILCIIQVPTAQLLDQIDHLLNEISERLHSSDKPLKFTNEEEHIINELSDVTIFGSETCFDNPNTLSILNVLNRLQHFQNNTNFHRPIQYKMCSLKWLYENQSYPEPYRLSNDDNCNISQIIPTIMRLNNWMKDIQKLLKSLPKNLNILTSNRWSKDIPEQFGILLSTYEQYRTELRSTLIDVRRGIRKSAEINNIISNRYYSSLREPAIGVFYNEVDQWLTKYKLIKRLNDDNIAYFNVLDIPGCNNIFLKMQDIHEVLNRRFSKKDSSAILWFSSDRLKREKSVRWEQIYQNIIEQRQNTTQRVSLIYVDFSEFPKNLEDFGVRNLPIQSSLDTRPKHCRKHHSPSIPQEQSSSVTEINVLLMGETGVGKSTFINAFVNYLMFDTLEQAEQNQPVVVIPVSFLITIGNQFDERIVKFGDVDVNENYEHQGQSVTQQCKSYVFNLNERLLLRLIDTPGMGDTRGIIQDEKNIDHILTYINNLSHLNAICLLFKPNESRLNLFFDSCIDQLLKYLTPIFYNNIIFCFTNTRSTFFAPGNTGSLLRQMLKQEHLKDILFEKKNTFCFDSESFRYLAARKCHVDFDEFVKVESINSWTTSVTESVRLLHFILKLESYNLNEWQSIRKATLEISMLARPLMETLRLILYNWKLYETETVTEIVALNSNFVESELCSNCAQTNTVQVGPFYIIEYQSDRNKAVKHCLCPFDESHFLIENIVKYEFVSQRTDFSSDQLKDSFDNFLFKCDRLTYFLRQKEQWQHIDPFTVILERFLEEERQISEVPNINQTMNKRIEHTLRYIKQMREQNKKKLFESNEKLSLIQLNKIISQLKSVSDIKNQINNIKKTRRLRIQANECHVTLPLTKSKVFSPFTNFR
ncbi:unnamed protein product [Rotaria sp. Silwood2]|nr:unnamed protein product [Rotaria sp. Silwood2]